MAIDPSRPNHFARDGRPRQLAVFAFTGMTMIDWVAAYNAFNLVGEDDLEIVLVGKKPGMVKDDFGRIGLEATAGFTDVTTPDWLYVPGGNIMPYLQDGETLEWLSSVGRQAEMIYGACSGVVGLGAAGLIAGKKVTTIFAMKEALPQFGATYLPQHFVADGNVFTAAGTTGIAEMGLRIVERFAGKELMEMIQLAVEYDPKPTLGVGAEWDASPELVGKTMAYLGDKMAYAETARERALQELAG